MRKPILLTILICLSLFAFAQEKDAEEQRLRDEVYKYFDTTDRMAFEDAVHQLRSYYKTMGRWHDMYTAWENEIVYDINNDHFYSALKKTEDMNDFIMRYASEDEYKAWKRVFDEAVIYKTFAPKWRANYVKWSDFEVTEERYGGVNMYVPQDPATIIKNIRAQQQAKTISRTQWYEAAGYEALGW
jgi:hypothetical protein